MICKLKSTVLSLLIIVVLGLLSSTSAGCEPLLELEIENQTDKVLTIYVSGERYSDVAPGETFKEHTALLMDVVYLVEGVDTQGEIVYSRIWRWEVLKEADYKIVIPPSEENPYFPLIIENKTNLLLGITIDGMPIGSIEPGISMKKRPLSSEYDTYTVKAWSIQVGTVYLKTLTRSELEEMSWKIVIGYSYEDNGKES